MVDGGLVYEAGLRPYNLKPVVAEFYGSKDGASPMGTQISVLTQLLWGEARTLSVLHLQRTSCWGSLYCGRLSPVLTCGGWDLGYFWEAVNFKPPDGNAAGCCWVRGDVLSGVHCPLSGVASMGRLSGDTYPWTASPFAKSPAGAREHGQWMLWERTLKSWRMRCLPYLSINVTSVCWSTACLNLSPTCRPQQNLWMPCVPSSHTFAFVAVLQTGAEKGRSSNIMMTGSCRSSSLLPWKGTVCFLQSIRGLSLCFSTCLLEGAAGPRIPQAPLHTLWKFSSNDVASCLGPSFSAALQIHRLTIML